EPRFKWCAPVEGDDLPRNTVRGFVARCSVPLHDVDGAHGYDHSAGMLRSLASDCECADPVTLLSCYFDIARGDLNPQRSNGINHFRHRREKLFDDAEGAWGQAATEQTSLHSRFSSVVTGLRHPARPSGDPRRAA